MGWNGEFSIGYVKFEILTKHVGLQVGSQIENFEFKGMSWLEM